MDDTSTSESGAESGTESGDSSSDGTSSDTGDASTTGEPGEFCNDFDPNLFTWTWDHGDWQYDDFNQIGCEGDGVVWTCMPGPVGASIDGSTFNTDLLCQTNDYPDTLMAMSYSPAPQALIDLVDEGREFVVEHAPTFVTVPVESCDRIGLWFNLRDADTDERLLGLTTNRPVWANFPALLPVVASSELDGCDPLVLDYCGPPYGYIHTRKIHAAHAGERATLWPGDSMIVGDYRVLVNKAVDWIEPDHGFCDFPPDDGDDSSRVSVAVERQ